MDYFDYEGWQFSRSDDGSLTITPGMHSSGSKVFGEPQTNIQSQPITIPNDQVSRLITYCLTRDVTNSKVLNDVRNLERQHLLVTGKVKT